MVIKLYNNIADTLHVDKTPYLSNAYEMDGVPIVIPQDIKAPVLDVAFTALPSYNYAYIPDFARYYYINNIEWLGGNVWRLFLSVDVLMSFATNIKNTRAVVSRLEDKGLDGNYFIDDRLTAQASMYEDIEIKGMNVVAGGLNIRENEGEGRYILFSSNAHAGASKLAGLTVTGGTLSPAFDRDNTSYVLYVTGLAHIYLTFDTEGFDPDVNITVNGNQVYSGNAPEGAFYIGWIKSGDTIVIRYQVGALDWNLYHLTAVENEEEATQ